MEKNFIEPGTVVYVPAQISEACISKDGKFTYTLESRFFSGHMSKTEEGRGFITEEGLLASISNEDLVYEFANRHPNSTILLIPSSEEATNGDMIRALYPDGEIIEKEGIDTVTIKANGRSLHFYKDWWYAKYKNDNLKEESKDKNDELLDPYDSNFEEAKEMIYNGFCEHDCESHYKCPVCDKDYGSWKLFNFDKVFSCNCGTLLKTPK